MRVALVLAAILCAAPLGADEPLGGPVGFAVLNLRTRRPREQWLTKTRVWVWRAAAECEGSLT